MFCFVFLNDQSSPLRASLLLGTMDVGSVEDWSRGARQQSPGGEQQLEGSRYEAGLALVDSGGDPRAWLALVQPCGTCPAHAASADYLQRSCHGERRHWAATGSRDRRC